MTEPRHFDPVYVCFLVHVTWLHFTYSLGYFSDNPKSACSDPGAWTEVDPAAKDQAFLVVLADQP